MLFNKKLLLLLTLFVPLLSISQTQKELQKIKADTDQKELSFLSKRFQDRYEAQKKEAYQYAKAHGLPTMIEEENGEYSVLQRLTKDKNLIYYTPNNEGAATTTHTSSLYDGGSLGLNIEGQNMILGVWDGGAVRKSHELLTGRVTQLDNPQGLSNHSTHVAGTMIGSPIPQNGTARGMAFKANLHAYDYDEDVPEVADAVADGLLVSNHSYGVNAEYINVEYFGYYDQTAAAYDEIAYSAPYYMMVNAAGNDRGEGFNPTDDGYDLLLGQALAKNNITVAASYGVTEYTDPSSVQITGFSSFGPPDDGRIKPDITGKGYNVFSSTAITDESYDSYSGTSMASPNVSGSLILLQQLQNNVYGNFMKGSTLKAMVVNSALETGDYDGPDYRFGWGLLNMEGAGKIILNRDFTSIYEEKTLENEGEYTKEVTALGDEPLKATLVWTDPAGGYNYSAEVNHTPKLINDLDITLEDEDGNIFYPWKLDPDSPEAGATKDEENSVDNVEAVEISEASGNYTITINHKGSLENDSQDYSLVITGISETEFTFVPDNIAKSVCSSETTEFNFNYQFSEDYTQETNFTVSGLPTEVTATFSDNDLTESGDFTLTLGDLEDVEEGVYEFTVTGTSADGEIVIEKELTVNIQDSGSIENPTLISPEMNQSDVTLYPDLSWEAVDGAELYVVEISNEEDFNSVIFSTELEGTSTPVAGLNEETTYYWRVQALKNCFTTDFVVGEFTTETLDCTSLISSTDTPLSISDQYPGSKSVSITFEEDVPVQNLQVYVNISHSYLGDLDLYLTSPEGTEVQLADQPCGDRADIDAYFEQNGVAISCNYNPPSLSGTIKPFEDFTPIIGESAEGEWTLTVVDNYPGDGGSINDFGLEICSDEVLSLDHQENIAGLKLYPNPARDSFQIAMKAASSEVSVTIYDLSGRQISTQNFAAGLTTQQINAANLSAGVYFVEIGVEGKTETRKLIIE